MKIEVTRRELLKLAAAGAAAGAGVSVGKSAQADQAVEGCYIHRRGANWTFGTATVERKTALVDGRFILEHFKNLVSGAEMVPAGKGSGEFSFYMNDHPEEVSGESGGWKLISSTRRRQKQGEMKLSVTLERDGLEVTKSCVIYPGSSIIREWVTFCNRSSKPITISEPSFLNLAIRLGDPSKLKFLWMTGGENQPGSWDIRKENLIPKSPRTFDSYEPFPFANDVGKAFPGDGVNAAILLNNRPVWPADGWQYLPNATVRKPFKLTLKVQQGDRIEFMVNMNHNIGWDTTSFDPTITCSDGETHTASKEFSGIQGKNNWRYQYRENGSYVDLVYYPEHKQWRKAIDNAAGVPFISPDSEHPDVNQDVARVWTAPRSGEIQIEGTICNTGNGGATNLDYGFRPGSGSYAPWAALHSSDTEDGIFIGWDYFGHWKSSFTLEENGEVSIKLGLAGFKQKLEHGESFSTPKAFTGLFREDIDNAGNECLDWQYRYLWDYTRKDWFPAVRMLGYWYKGTEWGQPGATWLGGDPDWGSDFRKIFRVADLMREVGGDVYHRDWGWWDRAGDWNGPDFLASGRYLRKYGMGQLLYAFLYTVDLKSHVARDHPEWLIGNTLDMSKPQVVKFIGAQLDEFVRRWGAFEWRNDSFFTAPRNGDDTPELYQDEGLREIIRGFLDRHPQCAFQAVNGGGNYGGYDYIRYASALSFSDGAVGILSNYYASLLFPPDKTCDIPDVWNPDKYDKATWRGLLCCNFDMTGDTWDPEKLEGLRVLIDIYHYLFHQGVVGRWVRVYRPLVTGDQQTLYLQRMSGDHKRGIIIPKRPAPDSVTIYPKGLSADSEYIISYQETSGNEKRTGGDLMKNGIFIKQMPPGELIYLNLPLHPGSALDTERPTAPGDVKKRCGDNMGYPGVEIDWRKSSDNNWVSYYKILRDSVVIDKVAKGSYYFDHSAGADLAAVYEVQAVDGAGNASDLGTASGPPSKRSQIIDDKPGDRISYAGQWEHTENLQPAFGGTLSSSCHQGATAEVQFTGKSALVFSKLGSNCGVMGISVDDGPIQKVDTYSADDIWGVCIYQKSFLARGPHTLKAIVLGERSKRGPHCCVCIDGIRVEE